jgi:hypothetical protein
MNMLKIPLIALFLFNLACQTASGDISNLQLPSSEGETEIPLRTSVCELAKDPAAFNQKLIEITGFVSRGFEDSFLFDPSCTKRFAIWVEIGGTKRTGTMYCCGETSERTRPDDLVVENIRIPLVEDQQFKRFDGLFQSKSNSIVHATMVGRYFSGTKEKWNNGTEHWGGYGHMGMASLFVVQRVISVAPRDRTDLDYGSSVDQPDTDSEGCGSYTILRDDDPKSDIERQGNAESGNIAWKFNDPRRVASEELASLLKSKPKTPIQLKETKNTSGRIVYHWRPNGRKGVRYMVVVSRPYWLSLYAKDQSKTIWTVTGAYSICD